MTPQEVLWAREAHFNGEVTTAELADRFEMGVESVRKMLRGDTYRNVGKALPRARDAEKDAKILDEGALARLLEAQEKAEKKREEAPEPTASERAKEKNATVEAFLRGDVPTATPDADPFGPD